VSSGPQRVFLGVAPSGSTIHVVSSLGQRSSISSDGMGAPEDWIELATYGLPLPEPHTLLACVAIPSGASRRERDAIVHGARQAGWDGVHLVSSLAAVRRATGVPEDPGLGLPLVVVEPGVSSVGIVGWPSERLIGDDRVRPIAGREAREVAVSLRCLLKARPRDELRPLLRRVVVAGDLEEVERVGRRAYETELERLGVQRVEFDLDPYLVASGALRIAEETAPGAWRLRRRRLQRP